jgi:hypothetical protein
VGFGYIGQAIGLAATRSAMVQAGITNTFWSYDLSAAGQLQPALITYGMAIFLPLMVYLLGAGLRATQNFRHEDIARFAGVLFAAAAAHVVTLLRSDYTHLSGPSYLLPTAIMMIAWFGVSHVRNGAARGVVVLVSVMLLATPTWQGLQSLPDRLKSVLMVGQRTVVASNLLRGFMVPAVASGDPEQYLLNRHSPIPAHQDWLKARKEFPQVVKFIAELRTELRGRRMEHAGVRIFGYDPELVYFYAGARSISGMSSQSTTMYLQSEETAWIQKVIERSRDGGCLLMSDPPWDPPWGRLDKSWIDAATARSQPMTVTKLGDPVLARLVCVPANR